jgi:ABC-2 type transport system permease protein
MMTLLIAIVILLFGIVVFGIRVADPLQWTLAVVSTALCFTGIMMLLSTLGHNEQSVSTIGWSVLMPLSMIGGGMIPLFFMPKWMLQISHISPIKWSITAIEGAMWRGMTWEELLIPCSILIGIGLITFTLGVIVLKRKLR